MSCPNVNVPSLQSLSERINAATRTTHNHLNRLILDRLPLALPPHTSDPSVYVSGLTHIAPIYINFEHLWNDILESPQASSKSSSSSLFDTCFKSEPHLDSVVNPNSSKIDTPSLKQTPRVCSRIGSILSLLRIPDLLRAEVILSDIQNLTLLSNHKTLEEIDAASKNGALSRFLSYTTNSVNKNPQVLLAYSWVFYMALFSGGRYLRALLIDAGGYGADFWSQKPPQNLSHNELSDVNKLPVSQSESQKSSTELGSTVVSSAECIKSKGVLGLQLFHFIGDEDGEDLKIEFKKRMVEAESQLTSSEKMEIVLEAQYIFKFMIEMIRDLDMLNGTHIDDIEGVLGIHDSKSLLYTRDSISIAKERLSHKNAAKTSKQPQNSGSSDIMKSKTQVKKISFENYLPQSKNTGSNLKKYTILDQSQNIVTWPLLVDIKSIPKNPRYATTILVGILFSFLAYLWLKYEWGLQNSIFGVENIIR